MDASDPSQDRLAIREAADRYARAVDRRDYAALGVEHIATGLDHLLFVFGLLLLVGGRLGEVVKTVTAFTGGRNSTKSP